MPAGRPSKFSPKLIPKIQLMICNGFTDSQVCEILDINPETFVNWKAKNEELAKSVKSAKDIQDDKVEESLLKRAKGMTLKKQVLDRENNIVTLEDEIPPDATSMIFWLKNRRRELWRDRQEVEVTGEVDIGSKIDEARKRIKSRIASGIPKQ